MILNSITNVANGQPI